VWTTKGTKETKGTIRTTMARKRRTETEMKTKTKMKMKRKSGD